MISDLTQPFVTDSMVNTLFRVCIVLQAFILVLSINCLENAKARKDIIDRPEDHFSDEKLVEFTRSQSKYIAQEVRMDKAKGFFGILLSVLGLVILLYIFNESFNYFMGYAFAAFAFLTVTIRAVLFSIAWMVDIYQKKNSYEIKNEETRKILIDMNRKPLTRSIPVSVAGIIVSAFLLYHVSASF